MDVFVEYAEDGTELGVWSLDEAELQGITLGTTDEGTFIVMEVAVEANLGAEMHDFIEWCEMSS
jgi:hypothetical protein